jgi:hypothetical protein
MTELFPDNRYCYFKCRSQNKIWKISYNAAICSKFLKDSIIYNIKKDNIGNFENNPLLINDMDPIMIDVVVDYLNYFNGKPETKPPEYPLKNIHMSNILCDEYYLFKFIYDYDKSEIINVLEKLCECAIHFELYVLHEKICAIFADVVKEYIAV